MFISRTFIQSLQKLWESLRQYLRIPFELLKSLGRNIISDKSVAFASFKKQYLFQISSTKKNIAILGKTTTDLKKIGCSIAISVKSKPLSRFYTKLIQYLPFFKNNARLSRFFLNLSEFIIIIHNR